MNEYLSEQGLDLYDSLIKAYIGAVSGNSTGVRIISLDSIPTSSTTSYTIEGILYLFKIGDEVRVASDNTYTYYKLDDLITENNTTTAIWSKAIVYSSLSEENNGTSLSLVTTGDKYNWNHKLDALVFNTEYNASSNKAATMSDIPNIPSSAVFTDTKYCLTLNGTTNGTNDGTSLGTLWAPSSLGTSGQVLKVNTNGDGVEWGTISSSPAYGDVSYTHNTQSTSGAVTIDGRIPLHVITCTGNITSVSLSNNPAAGHSCHVIFTATSARTVAIAHNATTSKCPGATSLSLSITANGYVEVDFLNVNNVIYVRGV